MLSVFVWIAGIAAVLVGGFVWYCRRLGLQYQRKVKGLINKHESIAEHLKNRGIAVTTVRKCSPKYQWVTLISQLEICEKGEITFLTRCSPWIRFPSWYSHVGCYISCSFPSPEFLGRKDPDFEALSPSAFEANKRLTAEKFALPRFYPIPAFERMEPRDLAAEIVRIKSYIDLWWRAA